MNIRRDKRDQTHSILRADSAQDVETLIENRFLRPRYDSKYLGVMNYLGLLDDKPPFTVDLRVLEGASETSTVGGKVIRLPAETLPIHNKHLMDVSSRLLLRYTAVVDRPEYKAWMPDAHAIELSRLVMDHFLNIATPSPEQTPNPEVLATN